jgi:hypothetical protein
MALHSSKFPPHRNRSSIWIDSKLHKQSRNERNVLAKPTQRYGNSLLVSIQPLDVLISDSFVTMKTKHTVNWDRVWLPQAFFNITVSAFRSIRAALSASDKSSPRVCLVSRQIHYSLT